MPLPLTHPHSRVQEILSTGDVVCFDSLLHIGDEGASRWTSSDTRTLQLNEKNGVAVVTGPSVEQQKRVQVTHQDSVTAIHFDVREEESVDFVRVAETFNGHEKGESIVRTR